MRSAGMTIKDIAAALGVSPATVSRALAGSPRISEAVRQRVARAAAEAGYVPNRAAQSLVSGRSSGFVGLILPDPGYGREASYLGEFISGLGQGFAEHGMDLFLAAVPPGQSELSVIRNIVSTRRADGLVLARTSEVDPHVDYLVAQGFPFVTHGRVADDRGDYSWVDTDGASAFAEAFDLFYGLGHRHFGLVTIEEPMTFRLHRTEGLTRAIEARGDPSVRLAIATSPRFDHAQRDAAIRRMLSGPDRPTAILAMFDGLALAVLQEAAALGLSVPSELSVIGFDNIEAARHARPGLTTFESDKVDAAIVSARMLVAQMKTPPQERRSETHLIRPILVLRGSHGPAPPRAPA